MYAHTYTKEPGRIGIHLFVCAENLEMMPSHERNFMDVDACEPSFFTNTFVG